MLLADGAHSHDPLIALPPLYVVLALFLLFFIGFCSWFWLKIQRYRKLLNAGKYDEVIAAFHRDLRRKTLRLSDDWLYTQLSATHYFKGDFKQANEYLNRIIFDRLPKSEKTIYHNNKLNLLLYTDPQAAREYWTNHREVFNRNYRMKPLRDCIRGTVLAAQLLLDGDLSVETELQEIADHNKLLPAKAQLIRMLGLIAQRKGNEDQARQLFEESESLCPGTYLSFRLPAQT